MDKDNNEIDTTNKDSNNNDNSGNNNSNNNNNGGYEDICYLCHRSESKAGTIIKLPNNINICADCMQKTFDTLNSGSDDFMKMSGIPGMPGIPPGVQRILK